GACIFRGVADGVSSVSAEDVAAFVGNFDLTIAAQQAAVLLRLAVEQNGVVGVCLVQSHDHAGAVLLQVFGDFHALVVGVDSGFRSENSPVLAASALAGCIYVL